jgi:hypothetical protein
MRFLTDYEKMVSWYFLQLNLKAYLFVLRYLPEELWTGKCSGILTPKLP